MSTKRPLLLVSGGLDSTYMLQEALLQSHVDVLYVEAGQCVKKVQAEKLARAAIFGKLIERTEVLPEDQRYHIRNYLEYKAVSFVDAPALVASQSPVWLIAALYHFDPSIHSEVRIAYVMGDDALIYRHEMQKAWENLCLLTKGVAIPMVFPLMGWRKEHILQRVMPYLLEFVWVCELPQWKGNTIVACHRCRPCKRHDREMRDAFGSDKLFRRRVKISNDHLAAARETVKNTPPPSETPVVDVESSSDSSRLSEGNPKSTRTKPRVRTNADHW